MYRDVIAKLLFLLPPETAHVVALRLLRLARGVPPVRGALRRAAIPTDRPVSAFGLTFRNPIGLAAGFDKNARHVDLMEMLGFGFVEIGAVTARPWTGNSGPRLFRLPADRALINRMGLNNDGVEAIAPRLRALRGRASIPIFANVAKTPAPMSEREGIADYVTSLERLAPVADALVLNVSCPNTGDGRTFEDPELLDRLLAAARAAVPPGSTPLLVKLSADQAPAALDAAAALVSRHGIDGLVAANTTVDRGALSSASARLAEAIGPGGLSGPPLRSRALACVRALAKATGGSTPIVGVGGISTGRDARAFLDGGATLVQLYTGFVYEGPLVVRRIHAGL